jgi:hypothetical protein
MLVHINVAGRVDVHVAGPMTAKDLLISQFFRGMDIKTE